MAAVLAMQALDVMAFHVLEQGLVVEQEFDRAGGGTVVGLREP